VTTNGASGYCSACGAVIFAWRPRLVIGSRNYCAPVGSPCHQSGLLAGAWSFTAQDAAALLAADIDGLRRRGLRSVDPADQPAVLERAQNIAA
jgi:hypothetical protein